MKKYFLLLLLIHLHFSSILFSQEIINISISENLQGCSPQNISYININKSIKDLSSFTLPQNSREFRIFEFPLQKNQYLYNKSKYRLKDMTKEDWDDYFSLDTTNLYKGKLQNIAYFFVGLQGF